MLHGIKTVDGRAVTDGDEQPEPAAWRSSEPELAFEGQPVLAAPRLSWSTSVLQGVPRTRPAEWDRLGWGRLCAAGKWASSFCCWEPPLLALGGVFDLKIFREILREIQKDEYATQC